MTAGEVAGWVALGLASILGVVLLTLTRRLSRAERRLRALMSGAGPGAESMSLGELIAAQGQSLEATRSELRELQSAVTGLDASVARSVQFVGLVRYNPFEETGGDQSFAL